ncbi:unnamed protein product [Nezara viridula]|uniref:Uncharacterized protein n=1 Tax=Nezara viridula TaxID=85310 RepID=A0A9P0EB03_NEZVI|nr:unnamed protein product [Nezara viridula]
MSRPRHPTPLQLCPHYSPHHSLLPPPRVSPVLEVDVFASLLCSSSLCVGVSALYLAPPSPGLPLLPSFIHSAK